MRQAVSRRRSGAAGGAKNAGADCDAASKWEEWPEEIWASDAGTGTERTGSKNSEVGLEESAQGQAEALGGETGGSSGSPTESEDGLSGSSPPWKEGWSEELFQNRTPMGVTRWSMRTSRRI